MGLLSAKNGQTGSFFHCLILTHRLNVVVDEGHDGREHSLLGLGRVRDEDDVAEVGREAIFVPVGRVLLLDAVQEQTSFF